jgi:probable rRNA maturation factor
VPTGKPSAKKSAPIAVDLIVEAEGWPSKRKLSGLVARALAAASPRSGRKLAENAEIAVIFTDDARIKGVNRQFRKKNKPTNVLSFPAPMLEKGVFGPVLGDILLARETIEKEAEAQHLTVEAHLTHLVVHGFLHLLGYDHHNDADAAHMERLETAILGELGIADPYADG